MFLSKLKDVVIKPKPVPAAVPYDPFRYPPMVDDFPISGSVLGCGIVQLAAVYDHTVEAVTEQLQQARWKYEAALVIASTGKQSAKYPTEETLAAAGFRVIAEAPNMRHEYAIEEPNRHHVKLWVCDVTNIAKPVVVPVPPADYRQYAPGMRV